MTREGEGFDVVVVGGGPAGLSAAMWLGRYRRRTLLLDAGENRNRWTEEVHGYLAFDCTGPGEIVQRGKEQLERYPAVVAREGRVESVTRRDGVFVVSTEQGDVPAKRIILATGVVDDFPDVANFMEHYGASAFHCPSCDGFEAKDRDVVVFGWSEDVASFAAGLLRWARKVVVVTDGRSFQGDRADRTKLADNGIELVEDVAAELVGERGDLRCVRLKGGREIDCHMAFFSIGHHPVSDLAEQLGCELDRDGYVRVDREGLTTVDGVYAAGDLVPGYQLVQVAAAQGTSAAIACVRSL